jgi:hypothetical protein
MPAPGLSVARRASLREIWTSSIAFANLIAFGRTYGAGQAEILLPVQALRHLATNLVAGESHSLLVPYSIPVSIRRKGSD